MREPSREYIAYRGTCYTIEWYYNEKGKSEALEYFSDLPEKKQFKIISLFRRMAEMGQIRNIQQFRFEGDQIYAFKINPDRFLCFFYTGKKIIVTNAFQKKQDKLPVIEKQHAILCKMDYEYRVKKETYYE